MAFVRCSRGGKTRALLETASMLKAKSPDVAVIYISFNNLTDLFRSETDGLAALRRRIAYYCLKEAPKNNDAFEDYRKMDFSESDLLNWLGETPCVLFVDELNLLGDRLNSEFADFIKSRFLSSAGRYFAFSSHEAKFAVDMSNFMDSHSVRGVITPELPIVDNLSVYGCIPGLLVESHFQRSVSSRRVEAVENYKKTNKIDLPSIRSLLNTFLGGPYTLIPPEFVRLMDVSRGDLPKVRWIPFHFMGVLSMLLPVADLPGNVKTILNEIDMLFTTFCKSKEEFGDACEALFVIVLLIRCLSGQVDSQLLALTEAFAQNVSYNCLIVVSQTAFGQAKNVNDLLNMIPKNLDRQSCPHISVYYPSYSKFELYDVIVVAYDAFGNREKIIGYQLKEGKRMPDKGPSKLVDVSIVIRGDTSDGRTAAKGWHVASDEEIDEFFGENSKVWAPRIGKGLWSHVKKI